MANKIVSDSDLTSIANAIRTKGGTSAQLAFPAGFVSAIDAIPTGGGTPTINAIRKVTFLSAVPNSDVSLILPYVEGIELGALNSNTITEIDIDGILTNEVNITGLASASARGGALKTVNLHLANVNIKEGLRYRENLETFNAKCRVGATNTSNQFRCSAKLKDIYWQENKQTVSLSIPDSPLLTDASLVSIANGLHYGSAQTLTLNATPKGRCSTLMGTVSQVTDGGETYDLFTQDASGPVSLENFITTTKGWTLA